MIKNRLLAGSALSMAALALPLSSAHAQLEDEIIVTATKRAETAQSIPVAVVALGEEALEETDIDVFTDYLLQLPGVTASSTGPGQGTVYIRGVASTPPLLTTAGAAGLAPNVALYLDEQPVTQVGRNLDVYAVDLNRVEVLPGPQGTLFGASSQAGTIRLITNKPKLGEEEVRMAAGISFTEGGDASYKAEATYNLPIGEKAAIRATLYGDVQGGYIDNVQGFASAADAARFRPAGTVRANGTVVQANENGLQAGADLSGVNIVLADNSNLVEENFNDASYAGFRISGSYEFSENWNVNVTHTNQRIDTEGVFFTDPSLEGNSIQRFVDERTDDDFHNTAWTLEGRLGMLDMVYTGAFLERETDQIVDYTDYIFVGQYLPYYVCDYTVTYPGANAPSGTCHSPELFVDSRTRVDVKTHELRFTTPAENRWRATVGGFISNQDLIEQNDFTYPGSLFAIGWDGDASDPGFAPNFPLEGSSVTNPDPRVGPIVFFNDLTRTDDQKGIFGEFTFDVIEDVLSVTGGARWYDVDVDLVGSSNSSFFNFCGSVGCSDAQAFGANLDQIFSGEFVNDQGITIPDVAEAKGTVFKGNLSWTPKSDMLFYATYSEGFRPGVPNRPGANNPNVQPIVRTDELTNYEIGWKTRVMDNQLQFNGSAFLVKISDLQTTIFDPNAGTNLLFSSNAADAEVKGVEADFIFAPTSIEGLTLNGAVSFLDTEITRNVGGSIAIAPVGSSLSYAPKFQGNLRARYEFNLGGNTGAHVQGQVTHSAKSFSDIVLVNRAEQPSYTLFNLAAGIKKDRWGLEAFIDNVANETAVINNNFNYDRFRTAIARPRTIGLRMNIEWDE